MIRKIITKISSVGIMGLILPVNANWHAVALYRVAHSLYVLKIPLLPHFFYWINYILFGIEIHYKAQIGKRLCIGHTSGVIIGSGVVIGDGCRIYSGVVLGARGGLKEMPNLGDNVLIGTGAKVLGSIKVGDNVKIGANALVLKDISESSTVLASEGVVLDQSS